MNEGLLSLLLISLAIAVFGWGLVQVIIGLVQPESSKIEQRLTAERKEGLAQCGNQLLIQKRQERLPEALARLAALQQFKKHLDRAWPGLSIRRFATVVLLLAAAAFSLAAFVHSLVGGIIAAVIAGAIPFMVVNTMRARRQKIIADQLMDALEYLSRVLRAGHSLSTGFQMIADELPEPIASEFRQCHDQHNLGQPLEQAMLEMAERSDTTDLAFFVTSVIIQRQTGGDLAALLDNISAVIRNRIRLHQHVKALTAEGRFTGYILTALPPGLFVVLLVLNPAYMGTLLHTHVGRMLMMGTVGLQVLGYVVMRRIIRVKV